MSTTGRDKTIGITLIVVGVLLCSLLILAAFTPIGLIAASVGIALIVLGTLRVDRTASRST